jgi:endonuclease YncB( thermonuclease family)
MIFRYMLIPIVLVSVVVIFSSQGEKEGIAGAAKVIDGRTVVIKARRIRLHGIDVPELAQKCGLEPKRWNCGREAAAELIRLADFGRVTCKEISRGDRNLIRGICTVFERNKLPDGTYDSKEININREMVARGWALASGAGSDVYIEAEQVAQKAKKGIWRGAFVPPWEWRAAQTPR